MEGVVALKPEGPSPFFIEANKFHSEIVNSLQICVVDWWVYYVYDSTVLLLEALHEALSDDTSSIEYPFTFTRLDDEYQVGFAGQDAVDLYGFDQGAALRSYLVNITVPQKGSIDGEEMRGSLTGEFSLQGANTRVEGYELVNLQGDAWLSVARIESSTCTDYTDCSCSYSGYGSCCWEGYCRSNEWEFTADPTWTGHSTSVPIGGVWTSQSVAKVGFVLQSPNGYYDTSGCDGWDATDNRYCSNCTVSGYFPALWDEVARRVGIEYETVCIYPKGYTGIATEVADGLTDIAVGDFTVTAVRAALVDFVYPYENSGRLIIFNEPGEKSLAWMFLRPFDWYLWILLLCSIVWIAHLIWILEWNEDTFLKPLTEIDHDDTCCCRPLAYCWLKCAKQWDCISWPICCCCRFAKPFFEPSRHEMLEIEDEDHGIIEPGIRMPYPEAIEKALYMAWSTWYFTQDSPESYKAKWLLIFWQFVMLVITAAYTANMAAFLVVTNYENPIIMTEADIADYSDPDGRAMGVTDGGSNYAWVTERSGMAEGSYKICDSLDACLDKLKAGEVWGVIYDAPPLVFRTQQNCSWVTGPTSTFDPFLLAWPISKTTIPDYIKLQIDQAMLEMFSDGTSQLYYDNFIGNLDKCADDDGPDETTPITFDNLSSLWAIFGGISGLLFIHFLCFRRAGDQVRLRELRREKIAQFEGDEEEEETGATSPPISPPMSPDQGAVELTTLAPRTDTLTSEDGKFTGVKRKTKTYTHQSRGLRTQLRGTIDMLTQRITDDQEIKKLERQQKGDIQYIKKTTRAKAMKDFVSYLCEVEPAFHEDKLKRMLQNEDMTQSEIQNLWRSVSALNRAISDGVNSEMAKVYFDYVFALNIGEQPDWMPEVRDYANFTNAKEEKADMDIEEEIDMILNGESGNDTLDKEAKDLLSTFEDKAVIRQIVKHVVVSCRQKDIDVDDPENVKVVKNQFLFETQVFQLHQIFKKYRREHIRKMLLDLEHERDAEKKMQLDSALRQVVPAWEHYYKLYKSWKTQQDEQKAKLKAERRRERERLMGMGDIKEDEEKDDFKEDAIKKDTITASDAMSDMKKAKKPKKKEKKRTASKAQLSHKNEDSQRGLKRDFSTDLSQTNFIDGIGAEALNKAREEVREARDEIKPYLDKVKLEDTWTTYAEQAAELIERLHKVGLDLKVWKSQKGQIIFCLVGFPHKNLCAWADNRNVDVLLDPKRAIDYGCEDFIKFKLALATATVDEEKIVQARIAEDSKEGIWFRFTKSMERIGKQSQRRFTVALPGQNDDDDDDLDKPKTEQKLSRELWENIYCQYITKKDVQFIYKEIFPENVRLRLFYELLVSDENEGGAEIPIDWFEETDDHCLESCYPLHDMHERDRLIRDLVSVDSIWDFMKRLPEKAPVERLRSYYGEPVGYYFAFLNYYIRWLRYPAVVGLAYQVYQLSVEQISVKGIIGAVLITVLWSVAFVDFWKREESEWRVKWGMAKYKEKAVNRAQFDGDWVTDDVTGEDVEIHNTWTRLYKMTVSTTILGLLIAAVLASVYGIFEFRGWLADQKLGWEYWPQLIGGVANAVQIMIFNMIYDRVSDWLNDWENHSTQQEYENAMIAKMFAFKFVNTFNSLFILAFIIQDTEQTRLSNLRIQLISLFGTALIVQNIMEIAIPEIKAWLKSVLRGMGDEEDEDEAEDEDDEKHDAVSRTDTMTSETGDVLQKNKKKNVKKAASVEGQLDMVDYENTLEDMSELIIQYGYVTLFVVVFPVAPLLAYISNLFEMRVDLTKVVGQCKRPHLIGSYGLGTWVDILGIFQVLAVVCNLAIFSFATNRVHPLIFNTTVDQEKMLPNFENERIIFFFGSCLALVCLAAIVKAIIPDEPGWVTKHLTRQELIENVLVLGALVDENEDKTQKLDTNLKAIMRDGMITIDELPTFKELKKMGAFKSQHEKQQEARSVFVPAKV